MNLHRMHPRLAAGLGLTLACTAFGLGSPRRAAADLIRPNATQSFPDLQGNIVGTQTYVYDPTTQTGTFQVNNAPVLLATGPSTSSEFFVTDTASQIRSQTIQVKLDSGGHLLTSPGNSFALYGNVTVDGKSFSGLLLQGTPTAFGFDPTPGSLPHYDMNVILTGGSLKELYGPDAYVSIITETNNTFTGSFAQSFQASKPITNVRAYNAPSPLPVPEPSTLVVLLAFGGAGWMYRHRRCLAVSDLSAEE
jgi:hypothetical protein